MKIYLTDKQRDGWRLLNDTEHTRILFDGGARSGKTWLIMLHLIAHATRAPGAKIVCLRKCKSHVRSKLWEETLKPMLRNVAGWELKEAVLEAHHSNGSVIFFDGLDDKERAEKILGGEYVVIFVNEAVQISHNVAMLLMTRLSQNVVDINGVAVPQKIIYDTNPRHPRHWLHRMGVQRICADKDEPLKDSGKWGRIQWTPYDNPHLSEEYRATLDALPDVLRRRMRDGVWCDNEGLVYDTFNEDIHVIEAMPAGWETWPRYRAVDFGYTNPFVCLWASQDNDGRIYIYKERYITGVTATEHAREISKERGMFEWTVADHDAGDRADFEQQGIITRRADKRVSTGIQRVQMRLQTAGDGKPRLYIHSSCVNLIKEFYAYSWQPASEGRNAKEEPVKENDHALDALRYMIMELDARATLTVM